MVIHSEITSRERVLLGLKHKETDRIPFSLGFGVNEPAKKDLQLYLRLKDQNEVDEYLNGYSDLRHLHPEYIGPKDRNKVFPDGSGIDRWGIKRVLVSYGAGFYEEISEYPLKNITDISELSQYEWSSVDWHCSDNLKEQISRLNKDGGYCIVLGNGNIFETSWYMRGFEQMLIDIMTEPELAWELMTRVTDYYISYFTKMLQAADGMIDIVFTADDLGHQEGPIMSVDLWDEMIKPHHVRLNKVLHEYGVKVMYHTDGAVMDFVPGLIDMGIDILEALQFDAKDMDPALLKEKYGDRLCFHGGVSVQKTLPFGTPQDVELETKERIRVLGKNGGYILAPSHVIQAGTPPENIVAFLEASR